MSSDIDFVVTYQIRHNSRAIFKRHTVRKNKQLPAFDQDRKTIQVYLDISVGEEVEVSKVVATSNWSIAEVRRLPHPIPCFVDLSELLDAI
jgi:hypothetical protein